MRLALSLGGMTVDEMLEKMSDRELEQWVSYDRRHGLPMFRQEMYLAQVAQVTAGGKLSDFLLKRQEEAVPDVAVTAAATIRDLGTIGDGAVLRVSIRGEQWPAA